MSPDAITALVVVGILIVLLAGGMLAINSKPSSSTRRSDSDSDSDSFDPGDFAGGCDE